MSDQLFHIEACINRSSAKYGMLLNWQNPGDPFWHYGIGLSDFHVFDTGRGLCVFERSDCRLVRGVEHLHFSPDATIERLKCALDAFKEWEYSILGWNCEHLARLVATNQPRCYQSRPVWWLSGLNSDGDNVDASRVLDAYLASHNPSLLGL